MRWLQTAIKTMLKRVSEPFLQSPFFGGVQLEVYAVEPVRDVKVSPTMTIKQLVDAYRDIHGFMAGHLAKAVDILRECLPSSDLRVLSFTANLVATGLRGIIAQLLKKRVFNLVVTTCGSIDHDIARGIGGRKYYKGFFEADDKALWEKNYHRLGNVFIPLSSYGPVVESVVYRVLDEIDEGEWSVYEILWEIGKRTKDDSSILRAAYEANVPIILPGFLDGAFGTALYTYIHSRRKRITINPFRDEDVMATHFFNSRNSVGLVVGGGISKHHTIWWAQFREGFDCIVYLTTAVEYDGSLSGAHPREAITWGKVKPRARSVVVYGDATLTLPIIAAMIIDIKLDASEHALAGGEVADSNNI